MKKLTSILLALVLVFSFAACSNNSSNGESSTNSAPASTQSANESSDNDTNSSSNSKTLIKPQHSPEVFFYCTEAIPEPRVQVFAPLRSAQSTRPPDELRPIFRIIKETSGDSPEVSFIVPKRSMNLGFRSSLRCGRRRALVHRTSCAPSSAQMS